MEKKEFDEKKYELLTDEELKEVAGGASGSSQSEECNRHKKPEDCIKIKYCKWHIAKCVSMYSGY